MNDEELDTEFKKEVFTKYTGRALHSAQEGELVEVELTLKDPTPKNPVGLLEPPDEIKTIILGLRSEISYRTEPIEMISMWKLQEICQRFMNTTHGTTWRFMRPDQWEPGVRWIYYLCIGELELAEEVITQIEVDKAKAVEEREAEAEPRAYTGRAGPEH